MSTEEKIDKILSRLESLNPEKVLDKLSSIEKMMIRHDEIMKNHESKFSDSTARMFEVERKASAISELSRKCDRLEIANDSQSIDIKDLEKTVTKHGVLYTIGHGLMAAGVIAWAKFGG